MSPNTAGSAAGIDLAALEQLARAATPGDWTAKRNGVIIAGPMRQYFNGSAQSQIAAFSVTFHSDDADDEPERQQANADFCAAANPATVLALITLARATPQHSVTEQAEAYLIPQLLSFKGARTSCPPELVPQLEGTVAWDVALYEDGESVTDKYGIEHKPIPLYCAQPLASTAATQPEQASVKRWQERCDITRKPVGKVESAMAAEITDLRAALAIQASTAASEQQAEVERMLKLIHELSSSSMRLAADLVQMEVHTFHQNEYLPRDYVMQRVMRWRAEWDSTAAERTALTHRATTAPGLLAEILSLAEQGMCHGLSADDFCSDIVAKITASLAAAPAVATTAADQQGDAYSAFTNGEHAPADQQADDPATLVHDLVALWDGPTVSADDYNDTMLAIEERMRTFAATAAPTTRNPT